MSTGLQYVWEYRSPSKSVPPHYQCKLCAVSRLQHDMLAHVKGWKHSFRYLVSIDGFLVCLKGILLQSYLLYLCVSLPCTQKKVHADKVTCEEEEAIRDPAVRKTIKEVAAEVEKTEGRGQLKVSVRPISLQHCFYPPGSKNKMISDRFFLPVQYHYKKVEPHKTFFSCFFLPDKPALFFF